MAVREWDSTFFESSTVNANTVKKQCKKLSLNGIWLNNINVDI